MCVSAVLITLPEPNPATPPQKRSLQDNVRLRGFGEVRARMQSLNGVSLPRLLQAFGLSAFPVGRGSRAGTVSGPALR